MFKRISSISNSINTSRAIFYILIIFKPINSAITKTTVNVYVDPDDSTTPEFDSVLKDITVSPVSGTANLSPSRAKVEFQVVGGVWQWQRTIPV